MTEKLLISPFAFVFKPLLSPESPLSGFPLQAGERANESLHEFHVNLYHGH